MEERSLGDDAVSPVIGVVLMVAITVILATVTATLVLGTGDRFRTTPPQASFSFDYEGGDTTGTDDLGNSGDFDGTLTVTHTGGVSIPAGNLGIAGHASNSSDQRWDASVYGADADIGPGDTLDVYVNTTDTVRVTWTSESGATSATLGTWRGPDV